MRNVSDSHWTYLQERIVQIRSKIAVLFFFVSFNAVAACEKGSTTVFSCVTGKGKIIEVCDSKKTIDYSFGKPSEKPDLALKVPRESASTTQWNGMGRWISYSVEIPNGNTVYSVFWGADRLSEKHEIEAGINVEINKKHAATVKCVGENKITQNIEGIDLRPSE